MRNADNICSGEAGRFTLSDGLALGPGLVLQGTRMRYKRGQSVFAEGDPAQYLFRVVSGVVRVLRFTASGRRQIVAFAAAGEVIGIETGPTHLMTAEAVGDCEIALIRRTLVDAAIAEEPKAAQALLALMSRALEAVTEHAMLLARKGASERVAAFLVQQAARMPRTGEIELAMSRADIADYLGLTIESVSRAFTDIEASKVIALPSARRVVLRDRCALTEMSEAA
jgi:CRP/FNR family nitrogen fixation transcriptional regulator